MKKKVLFTAYNMDIGGVEKALLSLLKSLDYSKYDVTLILQEKKGVYLDDLPDEIKVIEYKISNSSNVIIRKIRNRTKLLWWLLTKHKKYDFAGCFTTSCIPASILARHLGKKSAFWVHNNYLDLYDNNRVKVQKFFDERKVDCFDRIIFVSNESRLSFVSQFHNLKDKCYTCNNIIDYKSIIERSKEKLDIKVHPKTAIFLNVSRHDEHQKRLTRLIKASQLLAKDNYKFEVWLIGNGPDEDRYRKLIDQYSLQNHIKLLGSKNNPYPYYKTANAFILTSQYEGFPVVYIESLIFNLPIITTVNVTDNIIDIKRDYGMIVDSDEKDIYQGMKKFIDEDYKLRTKFDAEDFNKKIMLILEKIINE